MKTKIHLFLSVVTFLFLMLFVTLKSYALDYTITFTGTGASTTVESVIVQNLTKGTTVTVPTGNSLNLSDAPNAVEQLNADDETIRVYPNSVEGKSTVSFFAKQAGSTQLNAFSIDGRKIAGITENLQTGVNSFQLSFPKGSFVIQVLGNGYTYTAKMINQTGIARKPEIAYSGTLKPATSAPQKSKSSTLGITTMTYATGDQLLYKGTSGNYSTIVTDVPTGSKTMNFDFVTCQDADLNNYSVVTIGTQIWMVENLKTTKYNDGTAIPLVTDNTAWAGLSTGAWCDYSNTAANGTKYGHLYNWYAVSDSRNIAPVGWHVPTDAEWTTLENYLIANGYNYDGTTTGNKIAKSLAATTDWYSYTNTGAIGNDLTKNNSSGFTALPGGGRGDGGAFGDVGGGGYWWSSTELDATNAWGKGLFSDDGGLGRNYIPKSAGFSVRCVCYTGDSPLVTTDIPSSITSNSAVSGGNVLYEGSSAVVARGVCWSTSPSPTIALSTKTTETGTTGSFTSLITGLSANTTYYLRAYAINNSGTVYGNEDSFKTFDVMDIDGNGYHSVTIGTQTWMVENLKTTKYRDGTAISVVTDNTAWAALSTPAYCWFNNDATTYKNRYGAMYNWYSVNTAKLAPTGWHVPTDAEWTTLSTYLGGESVAGGKLKEAGTLNWASPNTSATNETGFTALPGGYRADYGVFNSIGSSGEWWSSTECYTVAAWFRYMDYNNNNYYPFRSNGTKFYGLSVRCVRDLPPSNYTISTSSNPPTGGTTSGGGTFIENSVKTVTASPNTGYSFVNWTEGGVSVSSSATYQLDPLVANRTLGANFLINTYTLTVNATNGTVAKNPNQSIFNYGSTVLLTATASTGYIFTGWSGNASGSANPLSVTMDQNKTITANFTVHL